MLILLLASAATVAKAQDRPGTSGPVTNSSDIIVYGIRDLFSDVVAEQSLDDEDIAAYGVSTIDALLAEAGIEVGDGEEPIVLVNGERVESLDDIGGYPVEAVERLDVLPRGTGARVGGSPQQRVYSLTLRNAFQSLALTGGYRVATEGDWTARRGEAILTRIRGQDRLNVTFRVRDEDSLLESDRGVVQPMPDAPYDLIGNVVADPRGANPEIDPALSALAGRLVTQAAIPMGVTAPSLADFANTGNRINETDLGRFRTLFPKGTTYDLNIALSNRLAPWLRSNFNARLNWADSHSLVGLPAATLILPSASPHSPFSRDVGVAIYGGNPLRQRYNSFSGTVNGGLNTNAHGWLFNLSGSYNRGTRRLVSERQDFMALSGSPVLGMDRNPFAGNFNDLLELLDQRTRTYLDAGTLQLRATGSPFAMPAGPSRVTVGSAATFNEITAYRTTGSGPARQSFSRNERTAFSSGELPLTSREAGVLPALGSLSATFEFAVVDLSDLDAYSRYSFGFNWQPVERLRFFAMAGRDSEPVNLRLLGNPVLITQGVRYFDHATGETRDIAMITGGNPLLETARVTTRRLGITASPIRAINLQLNAELVSRRTRNAVSELPPASIPVVLAFPERFMRDANGVLTSVDARPINLERQSEDRFQYGFSFAAPLGAAAPPTVARDDNSISIPGDDDDAAPMTGRGPGPRPRLRVTFSHALLLESEALVRAGLPIIDLLDGGALGTGDASPRHRLDASVTASARGVGLTVVGAWQSGSELAFVTTTGADRLRFSPFGIVNVRAFVDGRRLFPDAELMRGSRMSLVVSNLFNERQRVRAGRGVTPLSYQPAYRDALGRTVEIELRKTF